MRVLLEGPEIEPLLAQVRQDYGPEAKIISADKVRTGGLGGFFARQRYELAIEVVDQPSDADAQPGPGEPADPLDGLLKLAESRQDGFTTGTTDTAARTADTAARTTDTEAEPAVRARLAPRSALISTAGPAFAEVMAGLKGGFTAHPAVAATSAMPPQTAPSASPASPAIQDTPDTAARQRPGPSGMAVALSRLGLPESLARQATGTDPYRAVLAALAGLPATPTAPRERGQVLAIAGELAYAVPVARTIAENLRLGPGELLLAGASTAGTGIHPTRRISGPAQARRRANRLHRAETPHIVVVDAPLLGGDGGWVREVCDGLGVAALWAVVDATRKTADTARHLGPLAPVDALAVYGAAASADPASVLALGPPVALLDGRQATPDAWAAVLSAGLADAGPDRTGDTPWH